MQEQWKSLDPDFPNHEVSTFGRVRRIAQPDVFLKGTRLGDYRAVRIKNKNGIPKTRPIHRLVALAFVPNPDNLPVVAHIDGQRLNNHFKNLRWASHKENAADRDAHGRTARGSSHPCARLSEQDVITIRAHYAEYLVAPKELARQFGVSETTIRRILNNRNWKHI